MAEQPIGKLTLTPYEMADHRVDALAYAFSQIPPLSQKVGTHVDEDGQEHNVWRHVFIPRLPEDTPLQGYHTMNALKTRSLKEWDALLDQVNQQAEQQKDTAWHFLMSGKMHFRLQPLTKQARRLERRKKIKRRQRRAQQRKLCRK